VRARRIPDDRLMEPSIFDVAGGQPAMLALAQAWHLRCLADPVVSHAFLHSGQNPDHVARLAAYWAQALGGPAAYTETMGDHTFVLRLHSGNGEHVEMDDRAHACFVQALDDAGLPPDARLRTALAEYFRWATTVLGTHPDSPDDVPTGLPLPRWSWDGPDIAH